MATRAKSSSWSRSSGGKSSGSSGNGRRGWAAKSTTDHEKIRSWAEQRNGSPASVRGTSRGGEEAGLLRIDFPGYTGQDKLKHISWDEFFDKFDGKNLRFLYQEKTASGRTSRFFKFVSKEGDRGGSRRSHKGESRR